MLRAVHHLRLKLAVLLAILIAAAAAVTAARTVAEELQLTWPVNNGVPDREPRRLPPVEEEDSAEVFVGEIQETRSKVASKNSSRLRFSGPVAKSDRNWPSNKVVAEPALLPVRPQGMPKKFPRAKSVVDRNQRPPNPLPTPAESASDKDDLLTEPPVVAKSLAVPQPCATRLPPPTDPAATVAPYSPLDFSPDAHNFAEPEENSADATYRTKTPVPVQRPWVEWGRGFYLPGQYPPGGTLFGPTNLTLPHYLVYGDLRTAMASNHNRGIDTNVWATKLQLADDFKITATARIHALFTPLNRFNDVTRLENQTGGGTHFFDVFNANNPSTAFFEGDAGAILGAAVNIPAKNSPFLDWPNYELTFYCGFDQITSDAFRLDN